MELMIRHKILDTLCATGKSDVSLIEKVLVKMFFVYVYNILGIKPNKVYYMVL